MLLSPLRGFFVLLLFFLGFFPPFEMLILDQIIAEATLLMQISSSSSNCWLIPNYTSSIYCKSLLPRFFRLFFETLQNTKHNLHGLSLNNSYWTLARDSLRFAPSYNSDLTRITQDYLPTECNNIKLMRWLQAKQIAITVRDCSKDQKPKSHQETFSTEKRMRCKQSEIKMPVMPSININLQANDNDVFLAVP